MSAHHETAERSTWGRARIAGRNMPAMAIALPGGAVLAAIAGVLGAQVGDIGRDRPLLSGIVLALVLLPTFLALVWVMVVDRSTLAGSPDRPEQSVENTWMKDAAESSFYSMIAGAGFGSGLLTWFDIDWPANWVLAGIAMLGMLSFAVRYLILSRRG